MRQSPSVIFMIPKNNGCIAPGITLMLLISLHLHKNYPGILYLIKLNALSAIGETKPRGFTAL